MKKINLEITQEQYDVLLDSLELYGRMLMGHTHFLDEIYTKNGIESNYDNNTAMKEVAFNYFNKIDGYKSHLGIANTVKNGQRALEMYSNLRYHSGEEHKHSVYNHQPLDYSGDLSKMRVEFLK